MRQVFFLQTHRDAAQIARLVRVLRSGCPDAIVLVSHHGSVGPLNVELATISGTYIVHGIGGRGDFSILDGYLDALRWLRSQCISYDWITNLSGQDFPIASLSAFECLLRTTRADGFLHHFDAIEQNPEQMAPWTWPLHQGRDRYLYQYRRWKNTLNLIERAVLRLPRLAVERLTNRIRISPSFGLMVGLHADMTPFGGGLRCYAGSYWHTIRAECANYLLNFSETNDNFVGYFRNVLVPDEAFIQTVLINSNKFSFINDNLRYVDFVGSRHGHPKLLTSEDLPKLIGSNAYFARKFEPFGSAALLPILERRATAPATI